MANRVLSFFKSSLIITVVGLFLALVQANYSIAAPAKESVTTYPQMDEECNIYKTAASAAMQNNLAMLDKFMSAAEKSMQRAVTNSCISSLAMLNLNLANLIPDFNFFGQLLNIALQKFTSYLTSKVCEAVNNVVGDWNEIVSAVGSGINVNSAVERWGYDVVQTYPGGTGGTGVGKGNNNATVELIDPGAQKPTQCITNDFGQICTDGTIQPPVTDGSLSGSQIGSEYGRLRMQCKEALKTYYSYVDRPEFHSETDINKLIADVRSKCTAQEDFYKQYNVYLQGNPPIDWRADFEKDISGRGRVNQDAKDANR